jgi:hypothetical protein
MGEVRQSPVHYFVQHKMEMIGQFHAREFTSAKTPVGCMALRVDLDVVGKRKAPTFPGAFFNLHTGGWSPNWVHSTRRPLNGLLYLPRVIVRMENLVE